MTTGPTVDRLRASLADRYRIERELGQGGMATVYHAQDLSQWETGDSLPGPAQWIVKDGYMKVAPGAGDHRTRGGFGDVQLHIEWATLAKVAGHSQERGNSGVYLMGLYEIQVLDSYGNDTYPDGQAASLYGQVPPLVNASRPPGRWQTYDIVFHRPRFATDGSVLQPARATVFHNGVLVQDNVAFTGRTVHARAATYRPHADHLPIKLQDHGNPMRFRNIWVRELPERP